MKVTAVLPAFNAEKTLERTHQAIPKNIVHEIILVDDASHDNTVNLAQTIPNLILIRHKKNLGYGGNQKTCYQEAISRGSDIVVMIHPDFQYDPKYIPHMIEPLLKKEVDMMLGSRFLLDDPRKMGMPKWRYWGNRFLTFLQNKRFNTNLSECHSGYRAYSRHLLENIDYHKFSDDFVFDSQMIAAASGQSFKIGETAIPTSYTSDSSSISFQRSIKYGLGTLKTIVFSDFRNIR